MMHISARDFKDDPADPFLTLPRCLLAKSGELFSALRGNIQ
jgi:hypothetical protein